jgi:G3E family GTPase
MTLLESGKLKNIVRSKGFAWIATIHQNMVMLWSQAGNIINIDPYGHWQNEAKAEQKIVFIGSDLDETVTRMYLDETLV